MENEKRHYTSKVFMNKEELFEENIEYVPYIEEDDLIPNIIAYDNLSEWDTVNPLIDEVKTAPIRIQTKPIVAHVIELYQCTICDYVNSSIDHFVEHFKSHSEENEPTVESTQSEDYNNQEMFLCGQCSLIFPTLEFCQAHMIEDHRIYEIGVKSTQESHSEEKSELINDCENFKNVEFDQNEKKNIEFEKETWMKPMTLRELKARLLKSFIYKCSLKGCIYKFETPDKRDQHIQCHTSTEFDKVRDFKCFECGDEHKRWRDNTKHMWESHQKDIDLLKCPLCDYKSVTAVLIFRHIQIHSLVKGFVCPECSKVFSQATQLRQHSVVHLSEDSKTSGTARWYAKKSCEICQHVFSNSKTLSKHIKAVHNKIKPFICTVCGHKSARKASLTIHMRQHTGDKPLKCKYCAFTARDPSGLRKHEICHSLVNAYVCKYCGYRSAQSNGLKKHFQLVHPDEYKKTMSCDLCKFNSVNEDLLKQHKADHKSGLIENDDSSNTVDSSPKNLLKRPRSLTDKPNSNVEISSDCFLPIESTDSINHDPALDTGGVTIPATHSEDTQFPTFINSS